MGRIIKRYINNKRYVKINKEVMLMSKSGRSCWSCDCCTNGFAAALILIGAAYALQHNGVLFTKVILWPWVLIAVGVCVYLFKNNS